MLIRNMLKHFRVLTVIVAPGQSYLQVPVKVSVDSCVILGEANISGGSYLTPSH